MNSNVDECFSFAAHRELQRVEVALLHIFPASGCVLRAQHVRGGSRGELSPVPGRAGEGGEGPPSREKSQETGEEEANFKPFVQSGIQKEARCLNATPKNMMDRISICEALAKRNETDPFLKGQTLNSDIYCQQLDRLKLVTDQKRPESANRRGVVFPLDNARPHMSVLTRQKLWELDWKVLMHPPYSPDLAPNDYHLFLAFQNFKSDKKLGSREEYEN
ncbi:histone-lysine N-methyltransferase SETMAR [Trichonephila clavipes]|nr:histone-lysine N-methyltransferase SETMAR [Trichonephila clavipes]